MIYYDEIDKNGLTNKLCEHCKKFIICDFSGGNGWLCEGSYCDHAEESFLTIDKDGINLYRLIKLQELENLI